MVVQPSSPRACRFLSHCLSRLPHLLPQPVLHKPIIPRSFPTPLDFAVTSARMDFRPVIPPIFSPYFSWFRRFKAKETNDSQKVPSFYIFEDTRSRFSDLSIKKKSRTRVPVEVNENENENQDQNVDRVEIVAPNLDASDQKSFEIVQKIIDDDKVEKLKVEQCKLYLRKHGLRLTGKKDILIHRIKKHISIMNGGGESKYHASSFVMNCKGLALMSATGPPCGTRVIAGRIVKESYGAAKQQHTFTIELLWSKGVKRLTPLHPLLIKGRNLYRLSTMRQRWENDNERKKILFEKHSRGNAARNDRAARLHEKEIKKALRERMAFSAHMWTFSNHTHPYVIWEIVVPAISWDEGKKLMFVPVTFRRNGTLAIVSHCKLAGRSHVLLFYLVLILTIQTILRG